ncbi:MAG: DUF465 domain-containing protein [Alphaproteobacteria bacterium]|nr:DUF465 domain-containing protein [Alphaproteobacteria bacterium]
MSNTPHELAEEFPNSTEALHNLRQSDPHFHKLTESYHDLNRQIHRGETDVEPMDDMHLEELKKKRLAMLDEIRTRLS